MSTQPLDAKTAGEDLTRAAAAAVVAPAQDAGDEYLTVPLTAIVPSALNPRKHFDEVLLAELAASMKTHGVLEPILVRTNRGGTKGRIEPRFEIVAGERRFRAAKLAGIASVPVRVKHLTDKEALEIMVIENLQREGLSALEEAAGYHQLHEEHGYTVEQLAEKVGKSRAYVYARLKLKALTKEAQALVADGTLTPGHAILLARLKPQDQKRALDKKDHGGGGVFTRDYMNGGTGEFVVASVRELDAWIDRHVRIDPKDVDQLQPEAASALAGATTVVLITHEHYLGGREKGAPAVVLAQDWKRADGQDKSKACDKAVTGFVSIGRGRGDAFKVCVDKRACKVHWPPQAKPKSSTYSGDTYRPKPPSKEAMERAKAAQQKEREEAARWSKALPAMVEAALAKVKKAAAGAEGPLGKMLLEEIEERELYIDGASLKKAAKVTPRGKTGEDLIRHLVAALIIRDSDDGCESDYLRKEFGDRLKALGLDPKPFLDAAAPPPKKEAAPKKAKRG